MARRLGNPLAPFVLVAALVPVAALGGCGSGVTFGVAPGPDEPAPIINEPDPTDDGGPPVVTPPDGGDCVPGQPRPATQEELEAVVTDEFVGAFSGTVCATCHTGNQRQGDFSYDASSKTTLVQSLLESGSIEPGKTPAETTFGFYVGLREGPEPPLNHAGYASSVGLSTTHRDVTEAFLDLASNGVPGDDCPDAGPTPGGGDDCYAPYPDADSQAYFAANLQAEFVSCGYCHATPPGPVNGDLQFNADNAWQVATERIEAGAGAAADTTIGKILRVDGASIATHPHPFNGAASAKTWIESHLHGTPTGAPGCE